MAGEYTSQAANLVRVNNLQRIGGSAHTQQSVEEAQASMLRAIEEMGRRLEIELDRLFSALRVMDAAIVVGISNTLVTAEANGLWEYDTDGNLVPKDSTT